MSIHRSRNHLPHVTRINALADEVTNRTVQLPVLVAYARNLALAAGVSLSSGIGGSGGSSSDSATERGVDDRGNLRHDEITKDLRDIETFLEQTYRNLTWAMQRMRGPEWAKAIAALVPNPAVEPPKPKACRFGCEVLELHAHSMCQRHYRAWDRAQRPHLPTWDPGDSEVALVAAGIEDEPALSGPRGQRGWRSA